MMLGVVLVVCAVLYGSRRAGKRFQRELEQRERHHQQAREDARHAAAVARCWEHWWRVVDTAGIEPAAGEGATLGLGPEVTLALVRGLLRDAEQLGDDTLARAVGVYLDELSLVLAQQGGALSGLAAPAPPSARAAGRPDKRPASAAAAKPAHQPAPAADETPTGTAQADGKEITAGARRHRQCQR